MTPEEMARIAQARTDSDCFNELFQQYLPLIRNTMTKFYIRDFAREDWLQEARIALLKAVREFDGSRGSKFGAYYKLLLHAHFTSLLRKYMAKKRRVDAEAIVMESPPAASARLWAANPAEWAALNRLNFTALFETLTPLEQQAVRLALRPSPFPYANRSMARALLRARGKITRALFDGEGPVDED